VAHIVLARMLEDPESIKIQDYVKKQIDAAGKWLDEVSK